MSDSLDTLDVLSRLASVIRGQASLLAGLIKKLVGLGCLVHGFTHE